MSKIEFIILISASAFSWSCFDYARKKMTAVLSVPITFWILMLGQIPLFLSFAGLFTNSFSVEREYYLWGALGIFINFFANALFIFSVSMSSFIKAIPMLSFAPVFSAIFSWIFLSEKLLFMQVLGICMVVWGAFLLNGFPSMSGDKKGPLLMQLAAVFWGLMSVLDKHCLKFSTVAFHSFLNLILKSSA
jgi:drug/metabolite transporter (DMT)-like permease